MPAVPDRRDRLATLSRVLTIALVLSAYLAGGIGCNKKTDTATDGSSQSSVPANRTTATTPVATSGLATGTGSAGGTGTTTPLSNAALSTYIDSLGHLPPPPPTPPPGDWVADGQGNWTRDSQTPTMLTEFIVLDPNASCMWPGAVLQGRDLNSLNLSLVSSPRNSLTISVSGMLGNGSAGMSEAIANPNLASVNDAIAKLVKRANPATDPPKIAHRFYTFSTAESLLNKLGVNASYGAMFDFKSSLDTATSSSRNNLALDFTQNFYTISAVPAASPTDWFSKDVTAASISRFAGQGNPPVYVSDISYGRRIIFLFSSESSSDDMEWALSANLKTGLTSVSATDKGKYQKTMNTTEMRAFVLGGNSGEGLKLVATGPTDIQASMQKYLTSTKAPWSITSPGVPISFRANYLTDNTTAVVQSLTLDRKIVPQTQFKYMLQWSNSYEPGVLYQVVKDMEPGAYGDFPMTHRTNKKYMNYVRKLNKLPDNVVDRVEVAGDQQFKGVPGHPELKENYWSGDDYGNLPRLLKSGLDVMCDEKWWLIKYRVSTPKPVK